MDKHPVDLANRREPNSPMTAIGFKKLNALVELAGSLFDEARASADAKCWRGAIILVSASIEASLLGTAICCKPDLKVQGVWPKNKRPPEDWGLSTLLELAIQADWLPQRKTNEGRIPDPATLINGNMGDALEFVRCLRNVLVHPGRHITDLIWLNSADEESMSPTYELCKGIADELFKRLRTAIADTVSTPITEEVSPA